MSLPRVIFMGTPDFAVPSLQVLAARDDCDLQLVVTQPDRPAGRRKQLLPPAVKSAAQELGLPILQTDSLRHEDVKQQIRSIAPDLVVVAAFGMILGKWILELPTHGCVNLHASLLPRYRGASPIAAAIAAGDRTSGVTLMQMDRGLDTGGILDTIEIGIQPTDTTETLTPRLAHAAAALLDERLSDILIGSITPTPQPAGASETRQLTKEDGRIDWMRSTLEIERFVRAMWSWPRAWTQLSDGTRLQIHRADVVDVSVPPGLISSRGNGIVVGTADGALELVRVQLPGGKPMEGHGLIQQLQPYIGSIAS